MSEHHVDVLIITALKDEADVALRGESNWLQMKDSKGFSYHVRKDVDKDGNELSIAISYTIDMGSDLIANLATRLIQELKPRCLAMTGICAGWRGKVELGDVIVAERVFRYDVKKLIVSKKGAKREEEVFFNIRTYNLRPSWVKHAQEFSSDWMNTIKTSRPIEYEFQEKWLLNKLDMFESGAGDNPTESMDRQSFCPDWERVIEKLVEKNLIEVSTTLKLLEDGNKVVQRNRISCPNGLPAEPKKPKVHVGAMATGNQVVEDPDLFFAIAHQVRQVLAVDMEAATVGYIAEIEGVESWIIVKSVVDYADQEKDDHFRIYASEASYRFLMAFIKEHLLREHQSVPVLKTSEKVSGVLIKANRILHGAHTGMKYYGYSKGVISLPHNRGGMLSFSLWNDMKVNGFGHINYFNAEIAGNQVKIPNYSTSRQIVEEYTEHRGVWGAAGTSMLNLAIPPGVSSFEFNNSGSVSGIELSNIQFSDIYRPLKDGFELQQIRPTGEPVLAVDRVLTGEETKRKYYGYTGGSIFLPDIEGGCLSFRLWNDQHTRANPTSNRINLVVGSYSRSFFQYSTSLDLKEYYEEFKNEWGPAGGADVSVRIPQNVFKLDFNYSGSATGIEISDVKYEKGEPIIFSFNEKINISSEVIIEEERLLHGATSGKLFYGFSKVRIVLPNNKGGLLSFYLWNDHHIRYSGIVNQVNISYGTENKVEIMKTLQPERKEFYQEFMDEWGPAGTREMELSIPAGITIVEMNNKGSMTGIEISDLFFKNACTAVSR